AGGRRRHCHDREVFVRTSQPTSVRLLYSTDPNLGNPTPSPTFQTTMRRDLTKIIPLNGLASETTYYMNVVVNDVAQFAAPPYPSFKTFPLSGTSRTFNFVVLTDFFNTYELSQN